MRTLLFLLLSIATGLANAAIGGFDTLRWDMTRQEVQRLHPNFEEWEEEDIDIFGPTPTTMRQRYGLKTYFAAGCKFSLKLEFWENKLMQVALEQPAVDKTNCRSPLLAELTKRYGDRPVVSVFSGGTESLKWETKDEVIVLRVFQLSDRQNNAVIYTSQATFARLSKPNKL